MHSMLPRCILFSKADNGWEMGRGGRSMTWENSKKAITSRLALVEAHLITSLRSKRFPKRWLEKTVDMIQSRSRKNSRIRNLFSHTAFQLIIS